MLRSIRNVHTTVRQMPRRPTGRKYRVVPRTKKRKRSRRPISLFRTRSCDVRCGPWIRSDQCTRWHGPPVHGSIRAQKYGHEVSNAQGGMGTTTVHGSILCPNRAEEQKRRGPICTCTCDSTQVFKCRWLFHPPREGIEKIP